MRDSNTIRKSYKYRLYRCDKKDKQLRHMIYVASTVWNHLLAVQRRYYRLTGKYVSLHDMNKHVLKLRKTQRFALWQGLHSQACQDVCRRIDDAYQRRDHHFKLAHQLCDEYDRLSFEDLNLRGMKALWGRKVSDLDFSSFISILEWVACKRGKTVVKNPYDARLLDLWQVSPAHLAR